jgi:hypothetical protein
MPDKMIDLGHIDECCIEVPTQSKKEKPKKVYPSIWIRDVKLPLSPVDVGKTFQIIGEVHITGIEERVREGQKGNGKEYNLEFRAIQINNARSKLKEALKKSMR